MPTTKKTGISIPKDVLERLDKIMKQTGLKSRSKIITTAIENYLDDLEKEIDQEAEAVAVITYTYNHHRGDTVKELLEKQHNYLKEILYTTHIHLSKHRCLETVTVKTKTKRIINLVKDLQNIQGVKSIKYTIVKP